jgi:hypothetical protein
MHSIAIDLGEANIYNSCAKQDIGIGGREDIGSSANEFVLSLKLSF